MSVNIVNYKPRHRRTGSASRDVIIVSGLIMISLLACCEPAADTKNEIENRESSPKTESTQVPLSQVPDWYEGEKEWRKIPTETKIVLWRARIRHEKQSELAKVPQQNPEYLVSETDPSQLSESADYGKELLERIHDRSGVDEFYRSPSIFGNRMVIWLPSEEWAGLSQSDQDSIVIYIRSIYENWGIGTGRLDGRDIMADQIVRSATD